ncbi:DUF2007 domain-containing protein [Lagierella sp.]|uniref:putative signal transducing protein n=1 Tax=Lagierella sp. TaxID=2849657 RepID=UPI00260469D5|nr:DUF2007 domain-containing protein [Lagierella sp.]
MSLKRLIQSSNDFVLTTAKEILKDNSIDYVDDKNNMEGYLNVLGAQVVNNDSIFVKEEDYEKASQLLKQFIDFKFDEDEPDIILDEPLTEEELIENELLTHGDVERERAKRKKEVE